MAREIAISACLLALNFLGCGPEGQSFDEIAAKKYVIYFQNAKDSEEILAISTTFSVSCPGVYNSSGTFVQTPLSVPGTSGSIQVIQNVSCSLTIQSFNDGTSTYSPNPTSLVISISAAGAISSSGTIANPPVYLSGSTNLYLFLASSTSSSLTFVYAYDPAVQTATFVPLADVMY